MEQHFLMGNEAIAYGAMHAGVRFVSGYPGTPSTEVVETITKSNPGNIHVEWSVNEKTALEIAAGAAMTGARALVTMKQVGLNVASDPLMSLSYIGVKGGMVVMVADDPGPISSQTEQDTRTFAKYGKLMCFDPSTPEEAYRMIIDAFEFSEKYGAPVIFRPTTRICHGCANITFVEPKTQSDDYHFEKDPKWVIFPRLSYQNHVKLENRELEVSDVFSSYSCNSVTKAGRKGIAANGTNVTYANEALSLLGTEATLFKVATPYPFPEKLALDFLSSVDEVLCIEELDPVIERELIFLCGKHHLSVNIHGKLDRTTALAGENSVESVKKWIGEYLAIPVTSSATAITDAPKLPVRPPVLCAGCPHRASFFAVKEAMKGRKGVFCGDIGCYTLGNAMPLDMVDTCLCMGAGVAMAQGLHECDPSTVNFAFVGDSTFFHTGIPGLINAVYNEHRMVLVVLDNSTTAMTGHQPHPGIGRTLMGEVSEKVSIEKICQGIGVKHIAKVNPLSLTEAKKAVTEAADFDGVSVIIFESPCIAVTKPGPMHVVNEAKCIGCKICIKKLGCPALVWRNNKAHIEESLCYGCAVCTYVCPKDAIGPENATSMKGGKA